jgi:hypothetical protein
MLNCISIRNVPYANCRKCTMKLLLKYHPSFSINHFVVFIYHSAERFTITVDAKHCVCVSFFTSWKTLNMFFAGGTVTSRHILKEGTIQNSLLKLQRRVIFRFLMYELSDERVWSKLTKVKQIKI